MISLFDIALLGIFAWAGYRMWSNTTSTAARSVAISSLLVLALAAL